VTKLPSLLSARPFTAKEYSLYGAIVAADARRGARANMGTAVRCDWIAPLENLRPKASLNLTAFRCRPQRERPFPIKLLERHPYSTQVFIPMPGAGRYLAAVALGGDEPDLSTLKVFIVAGARGISYKPGVWHHPMAALDCATDFTVLVWEDGSAGDCEVRPLAAPLRVRVPR